MVKPRTWLNLSKNFEGNKMEIKAKDIRLVDVDSLIPNFFNIQLHSKNPIRINTDWAEIFCQYKSKGIWVKVSFCDLEEVSKIKWKFQPSTEKYYQVNATMNDTTVLMSRFLIGAKKDQYVDHKNGDPTDNRRENLRFCSLSQNSQNRASLKDRKFKGVYFCKVRKNWVAQISINKKTKNLGRFYSEEQAARMYDEAAKIYHGEFAKLNFA